MARKMRDSGVEWIGEVPEGWEVLKGKYFFNIQSGWPFDSNLFSNEKGFPLVRIRDITAGHSETKYLGQYDEAYIIHNEDLLVGMDGDFNVCWWESGAALLNQRCCRIIHENGLVKRFIFYAIRFPLYYINVLAYSTTVKHLSVDDIRDMRFGMPSIDEIDSIVKCLDEKCAAIDGAVDELKRGIEDCKAWKKAIIFEAVTGKANVLAAKNANVAKRQMRDSGIPWIGEIPEGWGMECVKHLFSIGRGRVIAATEVEQEGYPVYSSQTKNNGLLGYISSYDYDRNQLTWTTDGANAGTVFLREGKHNCTNVCGTLMPRDDSFSLRFVCYSLGYVTQYERRSDINGFKIMSNEMAHIKFPLPPLPEQQAIANYLDEKCAAIDALVAEKEKLIADLETYKKSLIFELVTGKREVA